MALKLGIRHLFASCKTCSKRRYIFTSCRFLHQDGERPAIWDAESLLDIGTGNVFTTEHDILRQSVRRFIREEIIPPYPRWEEQGFTDKEIWQSAGDKGFLCINVPEDKGGHGGDVYSASIMWDEMWRHNLPAPAFANVSDVVARYVANHGSPSMIEKYMPGFVSGESIAAIGWSEPGAGSDMQGFKTNARKDGDDYILNGSKVFITHGIIADVVMVAARTKKDGKASQGMSMFLVEEGMPGFKKGRKLDKIGLFCSDSAELFFEDVRLSKEQLIGEENHGFQYMMASLPRERLAVAGFAIGHCEWMFEETRKYVKERKAFGNRVADFQVVQHKLAEMKTEICIGRTFYEQCLVTEQETGLSGEAAAMVKYWTTDLQKRMSGECLQLHGGWGYMREFPISSAYLHAAVQPIYAGTNEIMKNIIAKQIVRQ